MDARKSKFLWTKNKFKPLCLRKLKKSRINSNYSITIFSTSPALTRVKRMAETLSMR
jgi:hypothetical protein